MKGELEGLIETVIEKEVERQRENVGRDGDLDN
jgi:hypothetical protein